jgi:hypothetical protein
VNYLLYEIAQARVAELHREGELQRRAALAPPAKRTATRRRWPNSLRARLASLSSTRPAGGPLASRPSSQAASSPGTPATMP